MGLFFPLIKNSMGYKILYHTSNPLFREKIRKEGLKPKVGNSYFFHWAGRYIDGKEIKSKKDLTPYIFLSKRPYDSTYDDDLWEVDVSEITDIEKDPSGIVDAYITQSEIPPYCLNLVYEGSGKGL